jgi:hypothetical protein
MEADTVEQRAEATDNELLRLYRAYRVSWLNKTYYATLADRTKWLTGSLQVIAAISSSGAFCALRQQSGFQEKATWFALVAAGCSFIVTYLGLTRDYAEYRATSSLSAEVHAEIKNLIIQIRRTGTMTDEQGWLSKYLLNKQASLESKDTTPPNQRLVRRLTTQMNRLFPDDETAWDQF